MRKFLCIMLLFLLTFCKAVSAQSAIDSLAFFTDENPLNLTLSTDINQLLKEKMKGLPLKATFSCKLADSTTVSEEIYINARGNARRKECYFPPLKFNFRNTSSPKLRPLHALKLVCGCRPTPFFEQFLLKEYLIYKIYNMLTEKSFRVRLVKVNYEDSKGKRKPYLQYAFFIEKIDAMAKRNHCKEWKNGKINAESTDRDQMTMVAVFQYMIGNTDWSVPYFHNVKVIYSKKDSLAKPYAVPYDFDYSGLVNADYAIPSPDLGIETVAQRLYRGYPRSTDELQKVLQVYSQQKEKIYSLVKNFEPLEAKNRKEMIYYLDEFYKTINNKFETRHVFIDNARN